MHEDYNFDNNNKFKYVTDFADCVGKIIFSNKSINLSIRTRSDRNGIKTGWGMQNKHPSMVDLSEWGDKDPHVLKHQNGLFVFLKK